jgi:hypothetical protein
MLLNERGIDVPQESIAASAGLIGLIQKEGSRIDQLADSVERVSGQHVLLARFNCTISELLNYLSAFKRPFGIEWQGLFRRDDGSTFEEGHYSVIHGYDAQSENFYILDPDSHSLFHSGQIHTSILQERWWERNSLQGNPRIEVLNRGLAFIIVNRNEVSRFEVYGLRRPTAEDLITYNVTRAKN